MRFNARRGRAITLKAFAKINLYLRIVGRREDGYHLLETVMQTVDVADDIFLRESEEGINFTCNDPGLEKDNLAVKAAALFYQRLARVPEISISLHKRIPAGAGLGGGSSDAAAVLRGLNLLYKNVFDDAALWEMARCLGADVPFFLRGGRALCTGIGDIITPLPDLVSGAFVLVKPPFSLSTATVYSLWDDLVRRGRPGANNYLPEQKINIEYKFINDLEQAVFSVYKDFACLKAELYELGADAVVMSGSGSALFAFFTCQEQAKWAEQVVKDIKSADWWVKFCESARAVVDT
ncbi:MAG: 4-(cytidine 5'-diphospho)-2-C-methyl-D-erythritol kinase [Desulfarculales bacterium]|jgi:4-diphosphocytidyl-2-C-methyl-D-erythritol kinase|nr:4-(cytidine 5'-diphospho)-2-C-methyl-D-erythritol kinase [Desulfarculales bacterium]